MRAYYNEHDRYAAQWLRNLIAAGLIPDGDVDERDVQDVRTDDLRGYVQCHFFTGVGGWASALRLAEWPDDEPIWTASLPCQPFSQAGQRKGEKDARHLWPTFRALVAECRPATVVGEQVASDDGRRWLTGVFADLDGMGYRRAGADLCAAGVRSPHIRQRLFWVADTAEEGRTRRRHASQRRPRVVADGHGGRLGDTAHERREGLGLLLQPGEPRDASPDADRAGPGVGNAEQSGARRDAGAVPRAEASREGERLEPRRVDYCAIAPGQWDDYELVWCREPDGTLIPRRIESGLAPLVDGLSFCLADGRTRTDAPRSRLLAGIGNAIVPEVAATFLRAYRAGRSVS